MNWIELNENNSPLMKKIGNVLHSDYIILKSHDYITIGHITMKPKELPYFFDYKTNGDNLKKTFLENSPFAHWMYAYNYPNIKELHDEMITMFHNPLDIQSIEHINTVMEQIYNFYH